MNWQKLCNNAAKFKKKPEVINLILVRKKGKIQKEETRHDLNLPEESHEGRNDINNNNTNNNGVIDEQADELTENNKELKRNLQIQSYGSLLLATVTANSETPQNEAK